MLGAIIGDIVGSRFEFHNHKSTVFTLFTRDNRFTDDTVMTLAVAEALLNQQSGGGDLAALTIKSMQRLGRLYPDAGYGGRFRAWLNSADPRPYQSYGNGSAMRVSPCAWLANSLEEVKALSRTVSAVTHDHPEGLRGAEATAVAIYLARNGASLSGIREVMERDYYPLDFTLEAIRGDYTFDVSCQGSVPQALEAVFEGRNFEETLRLAISIGGDSDTIAAIACSIAEGLYGIPEDHAAQAAGYLDEELLAILSRLEKQRRIA